MNFKLQLTRTLAYWLCLVGFMMLLRPTTLPIILFIVPFALLFAALYSTWHLILQGWATYSGKPVSPGVRRFGLTLVWALLLLLILQSLGQLTLRDSLTVGAIAVIGYLYLLRNRSLPQR